MKSTVLAMCMGLTFWTSTICLSEDQSKSHKVIHNKVFDRFDINSQGLLHILLIDGSDVVIPKEQGRYKNGDVLTQETFENIRISENRHLIGWLGSYMLCAQSYPCTPELVIFDPEGSQRHISAPGGTIWDWAFINRGAQVVIHYGFPHGDGVGAYALYDAGSGEKIGSYDATEIPEWVREFQNERIRSINRQTYEPVK